jgi:hypothetical protein
MLYFAAPVTAVQARLTLVSPGVAVSPVGAVSEASGVAFTSFDIGPTVFAALKAATL